MTWKPTNPYELFIIYKWCRILNTWVLTEFSELRQGDIYRTETSCGMRVNPVTFKDDGIVAQLTADPYKNMEIGRGWCAPVILGELDTLLKRSIN